MSSLKEINDLLDQADPERLSGYINMFDRMLLYSLAANILHPSEIKNTINFWNDIVKKTIDVDASRRTNFLESTVLGRTAKYNKEPDGEELRLLFLKQLDLARKIVCKNFQINEKKLKEDENQNEDD